MQSPRPSNSNLSWISTRIVATIQLPSILREISTRDFKPNTLVSMRTVGRSTVWTTATCTPASAVTMTSALSCRSYSKKKAASLLEHCHFRYEYYFEKDVYRKDDPIGGHRRDWENFVVFLEGDQVKKVTSSCHGDYSGRTETPRLHESTEFTRIAIRAYH